MLNPDFSDMLSCLKNEGVEFLVVGAFALAAHGFPRATGDIDIWVGCDRYNAQKILRALAAFGAPLSGMSVDDFTSPDQILQLGVEPNRIDLLTSIDGVEFAEAFKHRVKVSIDELEVNVLSKQDLLTNKRAAGRVKDAADIHWLENNQ